MENHSAAETRNLLDTAAEAIRKGRIREGRANLEAVLRTDPANVLALLWMTKCVEDPSEKLSLFKKVLAADPQNDHAAKGIAIYSNARLASSPRPIPSNAPTSHTEAPPASAGHLGSSPPAQPAPMPQREVALNPMTDSLQPARAHKSSRVFGSLRYLLLLLAVVWLYAEVGRLRVLSQVLQVPTIDTRVSRLDSSVSSLASQLSYVGAIARNADMYSHSHYSDARLKKDVSPIQDALGNLMSVHGVRFEWRQDTDIELPTTPQLGFLAQELEPVFPELVERDSSGFLHVDYAGLTPVLVEAIRQQQAEISELQEQVAVLNGRIDALQGPSN